MRTRPGRGHLHGEGPGGRRRRDHHHHLERSGRDGGDFTIARETGVLTFRTLPDHERPADSNRDNVYEFTVRAHDGRNYGNFDVAVTVEDVNEITGPAP